MDIYVYILRRREGGKGKDYFSTFMSKIKGGKTRPKGNMRIKIYLLRCKPGSAAAGSSALFIKENL